MTPLREVFLMRVYTRNRRDSKAAGRLIQADDSAAISEQENQDAAGGGHQFHRREAS